MDSTTLIIVCASSVVPCLMMIAILLTAVLTVLLARRNAQRLYSFAIPKVAYGEVWQTAREYVAAGWEFDIINGDAGLSKEGAMKTVKSPSAKTTDIETKHARAIPGIAYMSFPAGYSLSVAVSAFERKHGLLPRVSFIDGKLLKLGPVPERKSVAL